MKKFNHKKWISILSIITLLIFPSKSIEDTAYAITMNPDVTGLWKSPTNITTNSVSISWNKVTNAKTYELYRSTDEETNFFKKIATIPDNGGASYSYNDSGLSQSTWYHYELVVTLQDNTTQLTEALSIKTLDTAPPSSVTNLAPTQGSNWVELSWNGSPSPDIHHYAIYRGGVKVGVANHSSTNPITYKDVGLSASTSFTYEVRSVDDSGNEQTSGAQITASTTASSGSGTVTKFADNFNTGNVNWISDGGASLTFNSTDVTWSIAGRKVTASGNIELKTSDPPAFTISASELSATIKFDYTMNSGDNSKSPSASLTPYYKKIGDTSWTQIPSGNVGWNGGGTSTKTQTFSFPSSGTYHLRVLGSVTAPDDSRNLTTTLKMDNLSLTVAASAPSQPSNLQSSLNSDNRRVSLTWDSISGITGYKIRRSVNGGAYSLYATSGVNSFVDPDVQAGNTYAYQAVAVNTVGDSTASASSSIAIPSTGGGVTAVEPPTGLRATSVSSNNIDLSWNSSPTANISHYLIWMRESTQLTYTNKNANGIAMTSNSSSYRVDTGINEQKTYYFRVVAVDNQGNYSEGSNILWETTPINDNIPPNQPILNTPRDSVIPSESDIGEAFIDLSWEAVTDNVGVERYSIEVKEGATLLKTVTVANPPTTGTVWQTVNGLKQNTTYSFTVRAFDASGNASVPSDSINATTKVDTTAPKIILKKPSEGATNVPYGQPIIIRFDEAIDPATVDSTSIKIIRVSDGAEVIGTVTVNDKEIKFETDSLVASINNLKSFGNLVASLELFAVGSSVNGLEPNTTYEVTVDPTITNTSGTPIEQQTVYTFTTGEQKYERPHGNYMDNTALCKYCHNAHTGERPRLLNKDEIYKVCFTCHDGTGAEGDGSKYNVGQQFGSSHATSKASHHPVFPEDQPTEAEGVTNFSCVSCHNPHDSGKNLDTGENNPSWKRLLDSYNKGDLSSIKPTSDHEGKNFCWNCHGNTGSDGGTGQNGYSYGYLDDTDKNGASILNQTAVTGIAFSETRYRTDHQTNFPKDSPTSPPVTSKPVYGYGHNSWRMETYKKDFVPNGSTVTGTTDPDGSSASGTNITCVACHEKHGSDVKPLLRNDINGNDPTTNPIKNGKEFCYQCHQNAIEYAYSDSLTPRETSMNNYDGKAINEERGHAQFDCQVCHNPHGSPYPNYLRLNYRVDTSSYKSFNDSDAALCFDCHDKNKVLTGGATVRGRTGDLPAEYYHNYHVRNSDGKDISATCKNCHRPHGSVAAENSNTKLDHKIGFPNSQVTGSRMYTRGDNGTGSCNLTCHGRDHSDFNYAYAVRGTGGANSYALKDNWKTESWLLNNRPTIYQNGANGTHFRDGDFLGNPSQTTPNDGYLWK